MTEQVLCVIVLLVAVLHVNTECPPSAGIYLMLGGQCISNGTYFRDSDLQIANGQDGYIHCVLPGETLDGGQWLRPDGEPVDCTTGGTASSSTDPKLKDPFFCTDDTPNANITLYLLNDDYFQPTAGLSNTNLNENIETEYKCCLPTSCSDPNANIMTINVFERVYITDVYVDLPSDVTAIPQYYAVHCIVTGSLDDATIKHYYDDDSDIELTQSYCTNDTHDGYSCSVDNQSITTTYTYSNTSDYTVSVEWQGMTIDNGAFKQSQHNGDHVHVCTAASGAVGPIVGEDMNHMLNGRYVEMTVKAPSSCPSIPTLVSSTLTSITINWTYTAGVSDVDGYVVNASSVNDYRIGLVNTSDVTTTTLSGLLLGTTYTITVRAYQDILGPPSDVLENTTLDVSPMISWSLVSPITNLLDTQYAVQCVTSNINPALVYWTVNDVEMNNTNYTLVNETDSTYNSTLLLYPNNELGQSVTITCSVEGVKIKTVMLKAPSSVLLITASVLTDTSINISWSIADSDINGFVVTVVPNGSINGSSIVFNSSVSHTVFNNLTPGVSYTISVFAYIHLLSVMRETTVTLHITTSSTSTLAPSSMETVGGSASTGDQSTTSTIASSLISTTVSTEAPGSGSIVPIVAGGAVGGIVVLIIIVIVILALVLGRRHNSSKDKKIEKEAPSKSHIEMDARDNVPNKSAPVETPHEHMELSTHHDTMKESTDYPVKEQSSLTTDNNESVYATPVDIQRDSEFNHQIPTVNPVLKEELWSYVTNKEIKAFQQEFKALYTGDDRARDVGKDAKHKSCNRFRNIQPYDDNRVVLNDQNSDSHYINASHIDGYSMGKKYIATQGPLKDTVVDFMRMIWLEKVQIIVMVTNLCEGGRSKCEQYWPSNEEKEKEYGPFTVKIRSETKYPEYTMRNMEIKLDGETTRHVVQYQLTSWPDHGVLEYPTPLILVHKRVMSVGHSVGGPLLIHCSAGVGRTGTFITLDVALEQVNNEGKVDIGGIVTRLRQQRTQMVQTEDQYIFIHDAVLEVITCGDTEIASNTFVSDLQRLKDSRNGESILQTQFNTLSSVTPGPDDVIMKTALTHPDKNRSDKYLPSDKHIVLLSHGGYINATFVRAYGKLLGTIIAQSPMDNTIDEFWHMIMQYRVSAIVMCCGLTEDDKETCSQYWPSCETPSVYGGYQVYRECETDNEGFTRRDILIQSHDKESEWKVTQFQMTNWSPDGVVTSPSTLVQVIDAVIKIQHKTGGGPVVVHCSDTVSRSGVYCAVSNSIEQCKAEGVIDVFQAVKLLRMNKPGAVNSIEQYSSVHDTVAAFLASNEAYANFL